MLFLFSTCYGSKYWWQSYMDAVVIVLPAFCASKRNFCVITVAGCAVFVANWPLGGLAWEPLPADCYLQEARGKAFLFWRGFPLLPELWAALRANLLSRSPAAGPHLNLCLYSFARCHALVVAAFCVAKRTCMCTVVVVGLVIRGLLIFSWDDAA